MAALSGGFDLAAIGARFAIDGVFEAAEPYGSGHINDTFAATWRERAARRRYIHQRINHEVFQDPPALMANIDAATRHVRERLEAEGQDDIDRRVLRLVPGRDGATFVQTADGSFWRTYLFIEGARCHDLAETAAVAFEAAHAFGAFTAALDDYSGPELRATIPHFHDTTRRYGVFEAAVVADRARRAAAVRAEIAFARSQGALADGLLSLQRKGAARLRITHNDTKVNNVLIDERTGKAVCVIDLDTVMPGLALFDFGDLVRTAAATAAEDETDLAKVGIDADLFRAIVSGYLATAGPALSEAEKDNLVLGAQVMTYQQGLRFLTDHLDGDRYFKVHRDGHNLDRARAQFALLRRLLAEEDGLRRIAARERTA